MNKEEILKGIAKVAEKVMDTNIENRNFCDKYLEWLSSRFGWKDFIRKMVLQHNNNLGYSDIDISEDTVSLEITKGGLTCIKVYLETDYDDEEEKYITAYFSNTDLERFLEGKPTLYEQYIKTKKEERIKELEKELKQLKRDLERTC